MKQYYLHNGNEQQGPFDKDELISKGINKDTHVWQEGFADWIKAGEIVELKDLFATPPPFRNNVPPPIAKPHQSLDLPQKKNKLSKILTISSIIVLGLIGVFVYQQIQHQQTIQQQEQESKLQVEKDKAEQEAKNKVRSNIDSYVTLTQNTIAVDNLLGGINNLSYSISNTCDYTLDKVKVKINYIKFNGDVWKTEYVNVKGIAPRSETKFSAPSSERGTRVDAEIAEIKSSDLEL